MLTFSLLLLAAPLALTLPSKQPKRSSELITRDSPDCTFGLAGGPGTSTGAVPNPIWQRDCDYAYLCQLLYYPKHAHDQIAYYPAVTGNEWTWALSSINRDCIVAYWLPGIDPATWPEVEQRNQIMGNFVAGCSSQKMRGWWRPDST